MAPDEPTATPTADGALAAGTILNDRYEIEAVTGQGSLGFVYKAMDTTSGEPVALRQLHPELASEQDLRAAVQKQLGAAAAMQHKNIVAIQEVFDHGDDLFASMELVEGQTLRELIARKQAAGKPFSLKGSYNVLAHLCNALEHAHSLEAPLIHGLPGPGAVLINRNGRVKLSDFGLLGAIMARSENGATMTDGDCLAPELRSWSGGVEASADIYALGGVLHMLLTGEPPADPGADAPSLDPTLPEEVTQVVARCLDPDPSRRFDAPAALKAAFYDAIGEAPEADPKATLDGDALVQPLNHTPPPIPAAAATAAAAAAAPAPQEPAAQAPPAAPQAPAIAPAPQAPVAPMQVRQQPSVEDLLAVDDDDESERWLVQKDRLDFGPFSMSELKRQLHQGQFGGDDMVKDQETGKTGRIRNLPQLREFIVLLERENAAKQVEKQEMKKWEKEKRRRTATVLVVAFCLLALGVGGAIAAYYLTREPVTKEKIVYRDRTDEALQKLIAKMEITFKTQAPEKRKKKRRRKRRPKKTGEPATKMVNGQEVTYLGDVTQEGGDARLSEDVVQRVMQQNFRKLVPCVYGELKRSGNVKRVDIDFGIRGTGRVATAKVNGKTSGPFFNCILGKMKQIKFPEFAGSLTPASFYMTLK